MKSSFRKAYEKSPTSDGGVILRYKCRRLGVHENSGCFPATLFVFGIAFFLMAIVVQVPSMVMHGRSDPTETDAILTMGFSIFAALFFVKKFYMNNMSELILVPDGLRFRGKNLAIRDVSQFGLETQTMSSSAVAGPVVRSSYSESTYIYADALGQRIRLTGHITDEALAISLKDEINKYYQRS